MGLLRFLRNGFLRDDRGVAAAEMALILPGIAFILLNVVDLSMYIWSRMQVDLAAQEAVGVVRASCIEDAELPATVNCPGDLDAVMLAAAQSTSLGSGVTVSGTEEAYYCADPSEDLVPVADVNEAPPADCSAQVTGSTSSPGLYISADASYDFSPIFPGASIAQVLPSTITRNAWLRLK